MGVRGLSPFLQKHCLEVFKLLPRRLLDLSGKRIVLDATLITQRLHFAQSPHPHRHVLGWYRIAKELSESGVSAICIFDGKERNAAKSREAERRRASLRLTQARGKLELDRLNRLQCLGSMLPKLLVLDDKSRRQISDALRSLSVEAKDKNDEDFLNARSLLKVQVSLAASKTLDTPTIEIEHDELGPSQAESEDVSNEINSPPSASLSVEELALQSEPSNQSPITAKHQDQDFPLPPSESRIQLELPPDSSSDLRSVMTALYHNYKESISQLAFITVEAQVSKAGSGSYTSEAEDGTGIEQIMTKTQCQLAIMEGELWRDLSSGLSILDVKEDLDVRITFDQHIETRAASLVEKSYIMSESFRRRSSPPPSKAYDECKDILRAMGVPCIEPNGPFEAEAVASSMVLHGVADYVASEDTDVLVYGAPMIRNISNRQGPLTLVSGSDVRERLALNHESYIDFALLLGTDFSERIRGIGPTRALKFIKEYGTIERILESETKYPPPTNSPAYLAEVNVARSVFQTLPPIPEVGLLQNTTKDDAAVSQVLQRYGLGRALMETDDWEYEAALAGNYFEDDPRAS